jgi:hypothetical protein
MDFDAVAELKHFRYPLALQFDPALRDLISADWTDKHLVFFGGEIDRTDRRYWMVWRMRYRWLARRAYRPLSLRHRIGNAFHGP